MRIGVFGGSFNPIHNGHLGIALKALDEWKLDILYVVPAFVSPFKTDQRGDEGVLGYPDELRWELVQSVCAADPRLVPWDVELKRGGVSYAIDTVRAVRARHPGAEVFFVVGEDSVPGLPRWKEADELQRLCRFVSYPRTRESSTEIRRRLAADESVADLVPACVAARLQAHLHPRKATLKDWILVTRPWSVTAPLVPFLVGAGLIGGLGRVEPGGWLRWGLGLAAGVLLVLACNLFNTWGDERKGVDRMPGAFLTTPQIQEGVFSLRTVFVYGVVLFLLAGALGLPTLLYAWEGAWCVNVPLLVASAVGFWGAVNYSTGVKYKYLGLGVPMVALLEGYLYVFVVAALLAPHAVTEVCRAGAAGTSRVLAEMGTFLLAATPVASLVGVILHGNDMRDIATDRRARVRSLAAALGPRGALALFCALHLLPYAVTAALCASAFRSGAGSAPWLLLPFAVLPFTLRLLREAVRDWRADPVAPRWLGCEQRSGGIHFLFGSVYALALYLAL